MCSCAIICGASESKSFNFSEFGWYINKFDSFTNSYRKGNKVFVVKFRMGIENMRRWPMYLISAICILLFITLINHWSLEDDLRGSVSEISTQLQKCSRQYVECNKLQSTCMEESISLQEQKQNYISMVNDLKKEKGSLKDDVTQYKNKAVKAEAQVNRTLVDVEICKTELQSLKNLQLSRSATLETLRLEKETLTNKLNERKERIEQLEKEVEKLKSALTAKGVSIPAAALPSKITPAVEPPKLSPSLNVQNVANEPVLENNAQEEVEETNLMNDGNDFDSQI